MQKMICLVGFIFTLAGTTVGQIKVDIKVLNIINSVRNEVMPRVKVEIGGASTTTDDRGRGTITVEPGSHFSKATGRCAVTSVALTGSVRRSGGSDSEPILDFPFPSNQTPTVTFLMRCDTDVTPGMVRVKIATTASCKDDPNGGMKVQPNVTVMIAGKEYTSNEKGVIDVDLPPGRYPISARWMDYGFGYVTQNGLRINRPEGGQPSVNLSDKFQTLEVRMFTCDETGQEKARAEIVEIGVAQAGPGSINVNRSQASGNGFVGMKLRDGDRVRINGTAKIKWLERNGLISFDDPKGSTVIIIGPDREPSGSVPNPTGISLWGFLKGAATFLLPPSNELRPGEWRSPTTGQIYGPNARILIKGTTLTVAHDEQTQVTTVIVVEGVVTVEPTNPELRSFELRTGQRADISPTGVIGPTANAQAGINIKTSKAVYGPGEAIQVEYSNPKASGWDWVIIAQPAKQALAAGPSGSVAAPYALQFEPANNQYRDVRGSTTFPPLPEGDYEARYISWDGGNNLPKAVFPFKVGNAPSAQQPPPQQPPTNNGNPPPSAYGDLTGLWRNPGGNVTYRLRQIGSRLYWGADGVPMMSFANIYYGDIKGNTVDGIWIDLPGSPYVGDGKIFLRIESNCRLVKTAEVNHYANEIWVRKNSPCDGGPVGPAPTNDLTGLWKNPGGEAIYRFRQVGNKLHWGVDGVPLMSFANKFEGDVNGNVIEGKWVDLPGSPVVADGTLFLKAESECRIVKTGEINHYRAQVWVKQGSICDVVGLQQKTNAAETTKTDRPDGSDRVAVTDPFAKNQPVNSPKSNKSGPTNKPKPKVEEIPDQAVSRQPAGQTTKPKVEEIPDGETISKVTSKPNKPTPKLEEIPDEEITIAKNDGDNEAFINETTTKEEQTPPRQQQPKQEKPAKPKREGPGIWERLGTAINQAVTQPQQPQQPPTTQGGATGQGGCTGGSYGIVSKLQFSKDERIFVDWTAPADHSPSDWMMVNVAGTNTLVTWGYLDINGPCGRKYDLYLSPGQYDVWLYWRKDSAGTRPVYGPVRLTVTQ